MYHSGFAKAKNFQGKPYRAENGNMMEHCIHCWIMKPEFRSEEEYVAKSLSYSRQKLDSFELVCLFCGEVSHVNVDNFLDDEAFEKRIEEALKEMQDEEKKTKRIRRKAV